jgi:hypothetical protein
MLVMDTCRITVNLSYALKRKDRYSIRSGKLASEGLSLMNPSMKSARWRKKLNYVSKSYLSI